MDGWPVMLNVRGRRAVVVGGGAVAARRASSLREAGALVTVIAPQVTATLACAEVTVHRRGYEAGDLAGAWLVVVATDDAAVNAQVASDAAAAGVLVNRADDPAGSDVVAMASGRRGPITVAVHSGQVSAGAAAAMRDELVAALRPTWVELLTVAAGYRARIQAAIAEPGERVRRLRLLASPGAMAVLEREGEAGLRRRCEALADPASPVPEDEEAAAGVQ